MWDVIRILLALGVAVLLVRIGIAVLGSFVRPIPEPPEPGELRKVRLIYRCPSCGTEVRMTSANVEDPEPPRHCMDDMELIATADDAL